MDAWRALREIVDAISEGFVLYDSDDRLVLCNERYRELYAISADIIVPGNTFEQIVRTGAERGQYTDALGRIDDWVAERVRLHRNPPGSIEQHLGDGRWLRIAEYKTPSGWTAGLRIDITNLKQAEAAVRQSGQRYRRLVERTSVMAYSFRVGDDQLSYVGPQATKILGYTPDQLASGAFWFERMHPDDRAEVARIGKHMEARRQDYTIEYRMFTADGRVLWLRDLVAFDEDLDGTAVVNGIIVDVTEQKRAETALRESDERLRASEQRLRYLVESTDVVPYTWDIAARKYIYIGPQTARILGYEDKQWTDEAWWLSLVHPDDRGRITAHSLEFNARPRDEYLEYRMVAADGRTVWVRDIMKVGNDGAGGQTGYGVMIDVTESKSQQEQLIHAQKIEAIGQLTGGIAHDFNNLLAVIIGNLQLLDKPLRENTRLHGRVKLGLEAAQSGAELTRRLLAFARRQPLEPKLVQVNDLLSLMIPLMERTLGEAIKIRVRRSDNPSPVNVDRSQLENAIFNLAINARDAMPDGGAISIVTGDVTLDRQYASSHPHVSPGRYVMIAVTDSGTGMTPEVMKRAFEPFFTTKQPGRGTGLGLSMVHGFVKQTGGHIELYSEPGHGTSVKIYLPQAEDGVVIKSDPASAQDEVPEGSERILVVDDNAHVRATMVSILESLGYEVFEADSGTAALAVLEKDRGIDLVFSDIVMPGGMNGFALAEEVGKQYPEAKVLLTSGFADIGSGPRTSAGEGRAWIGKPCERDTLARKIREVLRRVPEALGPMTAKRTGEGAPLPTHTDGVQSHLSDGTLMDSESTTPQRAWRQPLAPDDPSCG